jgi:ribose transport system substrate-binding protein
VDTTLADPSMAVSQIASDNEAGGKTAAETLLDLIGGKGKVMVVNVKPGISTTDLRGKGFEDAVKGKPGVEYLGQEYSQDDPAKAAAIVTATLAKHPDLKGIFATNLFSAEGSASGLRQAGKLGDVKIVGFDAGPKQVQDLKDGLVQALIAQKPADIGAQGVEQAYNALEGKSTTPKIGTESVSITKDNLADNQDALYKSSC